MPKAARKQQKHIERAFETALQKESARYMQALQKLFETLVRTTRPPNVHKCPGKRLLGRHTL